MSAVGLCAGLALVFLPTAGVAAPAPAMAIEGETLLAAGPPGGEPFRTPYAWQSILASSRQALWPDGTVRGYTAYDGMSAGPYGNALASFRLSGQPPAGSLVSVSDWLWDDVAVAVDGGTWAATDRYSDGDFLTIFGDTTTSSRPIPLPRGAFRGSVNVVPGEGGGRVVSSVYFAGGTDRILVADRRLRPIATLRRHRSDAAAETPDGGVLLVARTTVRDGVGRPVTIYVSPRGRTTIRRQRAGDALGIEPTATSIGLVALAQRGLLRLSSSGRVLGRRSYGGVAAPWRPVCGERPIYNAQVAAGPAGLPIVAARCGETLFAVELDRRLRRTRTLYATPADGSGPVGVAQTPLPDGRLMVFHADGAIGALEYAGAMSVQRGRRGTVKRTARRTAAVEISCRRPYGAVCSGIVELRSGSRLVGTAPYALPGRPAPGASVIVRTVASEVDLPRRVSARLVASR